MRARAILRWVAADNLGLALLEFKPRVVPSAKSNFDKNKIERFFGFWANFWTILWFRGQFLDDIFEF